VAKIYLRLRGIFKAFILIFNCFGYSFRGSWFEVLKSGCNFFHLAFYIHMHENKICNEYVVVATSQSLELCFIGCVKGGMQIRAEWRNGGVRLCDITPQKCRDLLLRAILCSLLYWCLQILLFVLYLRA